MGVTGTASDIKDLRSFFMGVLRWSPRFFYESSLQDLADAFIGFCCFNGFLKSKMPAKGFLESMLKKFPDRILQQEEEAINVR